MPRTVYLRGGMVEGALPSERGIPQWDPYAVVVIDVPEGYGLGYDQGCVVIRARGDNPRSERRIPMWRVIEVTVDGVG